MMSLFKLYQLVKANQKLADKRHPMLEKNKAMKVFTGIFVAFWVCYLLIFAFIFGSFCRNTPTYNPINGGILIFLILDFFTRFMMQETPAQEIKPYKLLPIKQNSLIGIFLVRIGLKAYNLFFLSFFVPFGMFTVLFAANNYGLSGFISYIIMIWLLFVLNSYWYLFWRSLINHNWLWVVAPVAIYAALLGFGFILDTWLFDFSKNVMHEVACLNCLPMLCTLGIIAILFYVNLYFQRKFIYFEIAKVEKVKKVKSSEMSFLNRFGIVGEYLKLEIKSIQRNKTVKKQFLTGVFATLMLCSLYAFTGVYDNQPFMKVFICMYCFACLAVIKETSIMCPEGNYIDCLMNQKESILLLLKAKYYFDLIMMIIPLLIIIMPIAQGKTTILEALGCMTFAAGIILPFLYQLAIYNNSTMKLNDVLTKSGQNNKMQIICSLVALFLPMIIMYSLIVAFGNNIGSLVIFVIGIVGIALHPWWLRNIYERLMKRRYENMSNFRATR